MQNIKDKITTICGLIVAILTPLTAAGYATLFPLWLNLTLTAIVGACVGLIGYYNGKNADGSKKTTNQSEWQAKAKNTPPPIE